MIQKLPVKKYFAVRIGRKKGVFRTWKRCQKETQGFPGAVFKKFDDPKEARAWINAKPPMVNYAEERAKYDVVAINGFHVETRGQLFAGNSVMYRDDFSRCWSEGFHQIRRERAELHAVLKALEVSDPEIPLEIRSRNKSTMDALKRWLPNWIEKGTVEKKQNSDLLLKITEKMKGRDVKLTYAGPWMWTWVYDLVRSDAIRATTDIYYKIEGEKLDRLKRMKEAEALKEEYLTQAILNISYGSDSDHANEQS